MIATKDRPKEILAVLKSLENQSKRPNEVIIVDGGTRPRSENAFCSFKFPVKYFRYFPPSAARQRNAGIKAVYSEANLVGFLDDDILLDYNALERMLAFWEGASEDTGGASFNLVNHPSLLAPKIKYSYFAKKLNLYSKKPGKVLRSGFQTIVGTVEKTTEVEWIPSTAAVWRRRVLASDHFDEWYEASSYLEDLEFSYRLAKFYRLAVVADARYFHYPAHGGRENCYIFGKREVLNRLYFVRKYPELSIFYCFFALLLRMSLTLYLFFRNGDVHFLQRILGNIAGFKKAFLNIK